LLLPINLIIWFRLFAIIPACLDKILALVYILIVQECHSIRHPHLIFKFLTHYYRPYLLWEKYYDTKLKTRFFVIFYLIFAVHRSMLFKEGQFARTRYCKPSEPILFLSSINITLPHYNCVNFGHYALDKWKIPIFSILL
jgi:hypothetical protein